MECAIMNAVCKKGFPLYTSRPGRSVSVSVSDGWKQWNGEDMSNTKLAGLSPAVVWKYFEEICAIPHGSGNTKQISDYLVAFAEEHGLEHYQDAWNNVIIIKEASKGCEHAEPLILQGHMDMVCEQDADCTKDMTRDGIDLIVDGDILTADKTTLGADDGIAVAFALAALSDESLTHPRLEAVITVDEETGMTGARNIDLSMLKGHMLLNLDSEEEGVFIVSCAGGTRVNAVQKLQTAPLTGLPCTLTVSGLIGGHSGADIHLGKANAHLIGARALFECSRRFHIGLFGIDGGTKDNVIPSQASFSFFLAGPDGTLPGTDDVQALDAMLADLQKTLRAEYAGQDDSITLTLHAGTAPETGEALTSEALQTAFNALLNLPNGVIAMSGMIAGLTETSSNLGILNLSEGTLSMGYLLRSMFTTSQFALRDRSILFLSQLGFVCKVESEYSGWAYDPDSRLRQELIACYEELFHSSPVIENMHAGVECGILSQKIPNLDCVSIGPQMQDIHTSREQVSISSVSRCWDLTVRLMEVLACR